MLNFFKFIFKHNSIVLFIILEIISVLLIINSNDYQRYASDSWVTAVEGKFYEASSKITDYFRLNKTIHLLQDENANLRSNDVSSFRDDYQVELQADSSLLNFSHKNNLKVFEFVPAKIVHNSVNKKNNYIIINKGKLDGIETDMGVISPKSIVGVVVKVSDHYSCVLPILHSNFKLSAKLKNGNEYGIIRWDGKNYKKAIFDDIPLHAKISHNDTIVSSGYSTRYPENIPIAIVSNRPYNSGGFFVVEANFIEDYDNIILVYVVKNLFKHEINSLLIDTYE